MLATVISSPNLYHKVRRRQAYHTFHIPKRDGGTRQIHAPCAEIKAAHKEILRELQKAKIMREHHTDHGFVKGRGIHTALKQLQPGRTIIQADLKKAFHQITAEDIYRWARKKGAPHKAADWLARSLTAPVDESGTPKLVMGSPLAPAMLLELTYELRERISRMAAASKATVIWYADNVVVDSPKANAGRITKLLREIGRTQRWEWKEDPSESKKVLGWEWKSIQDKHLYGWRVNRKWRKRSRARRARLQAKARLALDRGDWERAEAGKARVDGLDAYARGPARKRPNAPTYSPQ